MSLELITEVCDVVAKALKAAKAIDALQTPITRSSSMENISEWDSLSFVNIFLAVSEHFEIEVDQDDAIQFTSIDGIAELIEEIRRS